MTLDFSEDGKVVIRMDQYVAELILEARSDMDGIATSPAAEHLFQVNYENPEYLNEEDSQYFLSHNDS